MAMAHGQFAASTPAARFWEQALPGSPMPEVIADFVQKGIDQSPLVEPYSAQPSISMCTLFNTICDQRTVAETGIYFHAAKLHPGSTMTLSFPAEAETPILPHDVADKVPFENLSDVLSTFHISPGSAEAAQVEDTLSKCLQPPIAGEMKACTTSLESTVKAAMEMLGTAASGQLMQGGGGGGGDYVWAATSALPRGGRLPRRQYVVQAVTPLDGDGYVSCHKVPFPYAVYQCHVTYTGYGGYKVSLRGGGRHDDDEEGPTVSLLAFCHFDTSCWNPMHPAFQILNTHPGSTPVCHFMSYGNLAFVKKAGTA
ncbi:BURP domain-containing protein 13 [Sorghum bicolor]|nr:BURP domain-containing protein 13 [Sorghum bicolor]|eukprot:XP_002443500.2 BURP domain-containing protein 13 [Sorghum bicolor]